MRARVLAPLVAALVGIAAGTSTALLASDPPTAPRDEPQALADPLGLGIPLVELECAPDQGVLILGFGDSSPALRAAIAENPSGDPSYLETAASCDTIYGPERQAEPPRYAVVLGPFDDLREPCRLRMDPVRRGDFVTALRSGNQQSVKCVCVLPDSAERPTLRVGMPETDADSVWVRSLQGMLFDANDKRFPRDWVTGSYDQRTADRVAEYQDSSQVKSDRGVVDDDTWGLLTTRLCRNYDF
ncbi:hypothetical protein [Nocardioides sp.]|uniref:hypothetical protein n=1 Tax=Nocardioides sp. TaxID=35761 RepID=UPI001A22DFD2|nr:hypothetical protein [Nocardioides sp.]MBJ7358158.1 hypothetical protein [Nocardioides sp.]